MVKCDKCDFQGELKGGTELHKTRKHLLPLIISSTESKHRISDPEETVTETEVEEEKKIQSMINFKSPILTKLMFKLLKICSI